MQLDNNYKSQPVLPKSHPYDLLTPRLSITSLLTRHLRSVLPKPHCRTRSTHVNTADPAIWVNQLDTNSRAYGHASVILGDTSINDIKQCNCETRYSRTAYLILSSWKGVLPHARLTCQAYAVDYLPSQTDYSCVLMGHIIIQRQRRFGGVSIVGTGETLFRIGFSEAYLGPRGLCLFSPPPKSSSFN